MSFHNIVISVSGTHLLLNTSIIHRKGRQFWNQTFEEHLQLNLDQEIEELKNLLNE